MYNIFIHRLRLVLDAFSTLDFSSYQSCTFPICSFWERREDTSHPGLIFTTVSLCVPASHCPWHLWNFLSLPEVSLRAGPWPNAWVIKRSSQHFDSGASKARRGHLEGSVLEAAEHVCVLGHSNRPPSHQHPGVPSLSCLLDYAIGAHLPACSPCAKLARAGFCHWEPKRWLIPTCQKDRIQRLDEVFLSKMN